MNDRRVTLPAGAPAAEAVSPWRALHEVWSIAWPTVATMTSYTVMQFIDKLMMGQVGPLEVAAQGNGGIWAFVPIGVAMGFLTVVNTFVSQNLGAGRPENGPKYAWSALWMSIGAWLLVLLPVAALMPVIFGLMHGGDAVDESARLMRMETHYGQILLLGAVFTLSSRALHHYFFGLHRPKVATVSAVAGNLTNVIGNYIFIFGADGIPGWGIPGVPGMPALGIYGAALGTVIGSIVEALIPLAVFLGPKMNAEFSSRSQWRPQLGPMKDLFRVGWPAATQYGNEILCWSLFMSVLVGMFGEDHMTAAWIALTYMHLSFMPAVGFSVAVTSLVGKYIGAGRQDLAVHRARIGLGVALVYMTACAALFLFARHPLVGFFIGGDATPEQAAHILDIGAKLMICAAFFQTIDAVGIVYTGALRGAGDTVFPGIVTMIYSWLFIILGGWLMIKFAPQLESIGPWITAAIFVIVFGLTMGWRFESGRWKSIDLLGDSEREPTLPAPPGPAPPAGTPNASVRDVCDELAESAQRERPAAAQGAASRKPARDA